MTTHELPADDPERLAALRPWRVRAWERIPSWARIALTAFLVLGVLHIALAVRIWYGLQDPPEVAAIQAAPQRRVIIAKSQWSQIDPDSWGKAALAGLIGVTARDVTSVNINEHATDELVAYIAQHFPNVESLYLAGGTMTTQGLMALKNCRQLRYLNVSHTNIDDGLAELLPYLPRLNILYVMDTPLGDGFAQAAARCNHLRDCGIGGTDISFDAVEKWKLAQPKCRVIPDWDCCRLHGEIRWSDGEITRRFPEFFEIIWERRQTDEGSDVWTRERTLSSWGLEPVRLVSLGAGFDEHPNGHYRITLKLNDVESAPSTFEIDSGFARPRHVTFRMPVTRAAAEQDMSNTTKE